MFDIIGVKKLPFRTILFRDLELNGPYVPRSKMRILKMENSCKHKTIYKKTQNFLYFINI
ncbi:hypothetical protein HanRHA438_Chr01g0037511 [Helianthus annuus]|nr:hypothetical protein HanRHA438_Chr01g0037511 [Helianthus annuus]